MYSVMPILDRKIEMCFLKSGFLLGDSPLCLKTMSRRGLLYGDEAAFKSI